MKKIKISDLTCSNMEQLKTIASHLEKYNVYAYYDLYEEIIRINEDPFPVDFILQFSKEFPEIIFIARYPIKKDKYRITHIVEFQNGQVIRYSVEPRYIIVTESNREAKILGYFKEELRFEDIYNKAKEIFKRVDIVKTKEDGNYIIDFHPEMTLTIEDDLYKIIFQKNFNNIRLLDGYIKNPTYPIYMASILEYYS